MTEARVNYIVLPNAEGKSAMRFLMSRALALLWITGDAI